MTPREYLEYRLAGGTLAWRYDWTACACGTPHGHPLLFVTPACGAVVVLVACNYCRRSTEEPPSRGCRECWVAQSLDSALL